MQRKLLESGNIFKRSDGRWNGVVWYSDEQSSKKRKSFCGTSKQEVKDKITAYLADFDRQLTASDESKAKFEESMGKWLRVFKFPSVERGTYDRLECTAKYQIYPILGGKVVGDITSADIKALLNHWMNEGYAYTTVKKVYNILTDYFRYLTQQEYIPKNPMAAAPMIKKSNFMASQGKEDLHPGGDHKVQGGGCQDLGKRDAHLSAGGRLYADAEHRTPHRRSPRTAEQRHRSGEPRHPPPAGRERGFQAGRHRIHQRPGGEDRQAEEHLQQTGCAPQSGGSGRHPDSESGAILRRGQPSHLG